MNTSAALAAEGQIANRRIATHKCGSAIAEESLVKERLRVVCSLVRSGDRCDAISYSSFAIWYLSFVIGAGRAAMNTSTKAKATAFHQLHHSNEILVLPNCWDALSAVVLREAGAKAIATTSAGLAWARGFPDGEKLPVDALIQAVREITRVVDLPVTVDLESGFSDELATLATIINAVIDAGAVGINLEDGTKTPELLASKIHVVKEVAGRTDVPLFLNARTDVILRSLVPESEAVKETTRRGTLYREAGGDGFFVPGLVQLDKIRAIVESVALPLNVLATRGVASIAEIEKTGAKRLSFGARLSEAVFGRLKQLATKLLHDRSLDDLFTESLPFAEINRLLS
jgi:2-methylisocitrate lyase-like PEP mutase family enzyme